VFKKVKKSSHFAGYTGLRLEVSGLRSTDWYTSCVFNAQAGGAHHHGIAFFQFHPKAKRINSARFFWNEQARNIGSLTQP